MVLWSIARQNLTSLLQYIKQYRIDYEHVYLSIYVFCGDGFGYGCRYLVQKRPYREAGGLGALGISRL